MLQCVQIANVLHIFFQKLTILVNFTREPYEICKWLKLWLRVDHADQSDEGVTVMDGTAVKAHRLFLVRIADFVKKIADLGSVYQCRFGNVGKCSRAEPAVPDFDLVNIIDGRQSWGGVEFSPVNASCVWLGWVWLVGD